MQGVQRDLLCGKQAVVQETIYPVYVRCARDPEIKRHVRLPLPPLSKRTRFLHWRQLSVDKDVGSSVRAGLKVSAPGNLRGEVSKNCVKRR